MAGNPDPYKVLGVPRDADSNAINRAYSQKKYAARGNDALTQQIEAAHSALMMSALTARMKGKAVAKDVAYADTEPLFPWRPKRWDATPKVGCACSVVLHLHAYNPAFGWTADLTPW